MAGKQNLSFLEKKRKLEKDQMDQARSSNGQNVSTGSLNRPKYAFMNKNANISTADVYNITLGNHFKYVLMIY